MNINTVFPSDYLKAIDIPTGRRVMVTIESVAVEKLGDGEKPVVYFRGKEKGLVLNKTNANMIIEIVGSEETEDWSGAQIVLYSARVDFQGRRVDALRVDHPPKTNGAARPPTRTAPPPAPPPVDDFADAPELDSEEIPF